MKLISIEECCSLIRNGASIKQSSNASGIPITRIETIATGCINVDKVGYANIFDEERFKEYYLKTGDILMSHINSLKHLGKTALVNSGLSNDIIHGMNLLLLRPLKSIDPSYFKYYFETKKFYNEILCISNQSVNQSSFTVTALKKIKIPLPPLSTQKAIAEKLDKADALRKKDKELLAQYDELAQAIFIDMFGDPVRNEKGWEISKLKDVAEVGSSRRVFVNDLVSEGIPFYRGTEIGKMSGGDEVIPTLFITEDHYQSIKKECGVPNVGDLLLPSICPDGRIWEVENNKPFYYKDGRVLRISVKNEKVNSTYLKNVIRNIFKTEYSKMSSGSTFAELKIFTLKELQLILPQIELQNKFAEKIKNIEAQKAIVKQQAQQSEDLFQALLQESFNFN